MKAMINSELLYLSTKLVKSDYVEVQVKNKQVKIISVASYARKIVNEVIIDSPYFGTEEDGVVIIPAYLIKLLDKKENIEICNNIITAKGREIRIMESDAEEFKEIEFDDKDVVFLSDFDYVTSVKYACENDGTRPVLNCIYINKNDVVALDGYRMAIRTLNSGISKDILIPNEIVKMHSKLKDKSVAAITENEEYIKFNFGSIKIISRKHVGNDKFPKYNSLIPDVKNKDTFKVSIDSNELLSICNRIDKTFSNGKNVKLVLNNKKSYIEKHEGGRERVGIKAYVDTSYNKEDEFIIAFNSKYMTDALKHYSGNVDFYFTSPVTPILLTGKDKKDLVLPVRIIRNE